MTRPKQVVGMDCVREEVDLESWLLTSSAPDFATPVYWAPHGWSQAADWVPVRNREHLAVMISTACRSNNNVCFVSSRRGISGRTANLIGLVARDQLGWAVILRRTGTPEWRRKVQHVDYPHSNYESFGALYAAEIVLAWVTSGHLLRGLVHK